MQDLVALIKGSIEPKSWDGDEGGKIYTMRGYLVVWHTAKLQQRVAALLSQTGLLLLYGESAQDRVPRFPPGGGGGIF